MLPTFKKGADGRWRVNPDKLRVLHFTLQPDSPNESVTIAALGTGGPYSLTAPQDGPIELFEIVVQATSLDFTVEFTHRKRSLQNYPIHARTALGGNIPQATNIGYSTYLLPETLWLMPMETLSVKFVDLSNAQNVIRFAAHGRLYLRHEIEAVAPELRNRIRSSMGANAMTQPFFYTIQDPTTGAIPWALGALGTEINTLHIGADGAFELHKITGVSTGAYTIQLTHPTGRALSSAAVHNNLMVGRAPFPYILPEPLLLKRATDLKVTLVDLSGNSNNVYLTLAGRRIYSGDEGL